MMTDDEVWSQALAEVEKDLGAYPRRDAGKSVIIGLSVFICCVLVQSLTVQGATLLAAALIAASVSGGHFLMWELRRWGYKHRLRANFWSIRVQEEVGQDVSVASRQAHSPSP